MISKDVTFDGFDGEETKRLFFNISATEAIDLATADDGENNILSEFKKLKENSTPREVMQSMEKFFEWTYGEREGEKFVKSPERYAEWRQSLSYQALYAELMTDAEAASEFVTSVFPKELLKALQKQTGGKSLSDMVREETQKNMQGHKPKAVTQNAFTKANLEVAEAPTAAPEGVPTPTDGLQHYVDRGQPDFPHIGTPPSVEQVVSENLASESPAEVMTESLARAAGLSDEKIEELRNQGLIRQTNP